MENVKRYIAAVSQASGLGMSAERQACHVAEFHRLLNDANGLSTLIGQGQHLTVGPITVLRHDERAVAITVPV